MRPRILMFSHRNFQRHVWRSVSYEFEDVIREVDDVEILTPEPHRAFFIREKVANQLARHLSLAINPGVGKIRAKRKYDLFFAACTFVRDLPSVNTIEGWTEQCGTSICWIEESWAGELHKWTGHLKILSKFDYVVLSCSGSVQAIQDRIGRPCFYMPFGVDTIRFCPYPNPPVRCVDFYSLGRRSPVIHDALLKMAEQDRIFYIYDTTKMMEMLNHKEHRALVASIAKRSRYFFANTAKFDQTHETQEQGEIGPRFFEGAAAGTVMIGDYPENQAFREHFDWPDAVIRLPLNSPDVAKLVSDLDKQPDRQKVIRTNNVVESLLRHDWVYRWRAVLEIVGLEPTPGMVAREKCLKELAEKAGKTS
jgi:hypothetical protein